MATTHAMILRRQAIQAFASRALDESMAIRNMLFLWVGSGISDIEAIRMLRVIDARRATADLASNHGNEKEKGESFATSSNW